MMKNTKVDHHLALPKAPTAKAVLAQVARKLRRAGANVPVPVEVAAPTIEGCMKSGLSIALCLVETELDTLAAAAPRNNPAHRALFSLPPIQASASADVAVPELPTQKVVTGDAEVDAVLWLREVISTGQASLIEKARLAATCIKTPLKDVEKRYTEYLHRTQPGNFGAVLMSFGFSDIEGWIGTSIKRAARRHEAHSRFGSDLLKDTPAEMFCIDALEGLRQKKPDWDYDEKAVDKRFDKRVEQQPGTLTDCILELGFWTDLYWLRNAVHQHSDCAPQAHARQDYVFRMLSRISPRDPEEAADVFLYLQGNDGMDRAHTGSIILNLIGAPEPCNAKREADHA
jgi:hypothetical protein